MLLLMMFMQFTVNKNLFFILTENNFSTLWSLNEASTYQITKSLTNKLYQIQLFEEPRSLSISKNHLVANYGTKIQVFNTTKDLIKNNKESKLNK